MQRHHTFTFGEYGTTVSSCESSNALANLGQSVFFVADTNTQKFLPAERPCMVLPAGEQSKSWLELERLLETMLHAGLSRDSVIVGVGGGVVCDIAAFAGSIYMRGCRVVLAPTTLLAMVDAALGGKTGVNLGGYKNMVGSFYPASEVRLCPEYLHALPEREYLSGLAEVIKTAMLGDEELFRTLESQADHVRTRDDELLADIVWRCVMVKGGIVEEDLRERGIRAHLNLGHTFAHALESETGLGSWSHGEAVAWGIQRAMEAGVAAGITDSTYAIRVAQLLTNYRYRTDPLPESAQAMLNAMAKDKKKTSGTGKLIVQQRLTRTRIIDLDPALVLRVLRGEVVLSGG